MESYPLSPIQIKLKPQSAVKFPVLETNSDKIKFRPTLKNSKSILFLGSLFAFAAVLLKNVIFFISANHILNGDIGFFQTFASFLVGTALTMIPTGPASIGGGHFFYQSPFNIFSDFNTNMGVELFSVLVFCHLCMAGIGWIFYCFAPPKLLT